MNQNERKTVMRRMVLLIAVAALVMGLYALRLIFLQLVNSDEYKSRATNTTDYNFTVTAARGDIVDSTGKRIATTTTSYNVVLNKLQMGDEDLDSLLQRLVELFEKKAKAGPIPCSSASRMQRAIIPLPPKRAAPGIRKPLPP